MGSGGVTVSYSLASNACPTFSTPTTVLSSQSQLSVPYSLTTGTNGCGSASSNYRYVEVTYTIDDSQMASFPDVNGNHTTITGLMLYYHPATNGRLRGGATFSNGNLQALDAPPTPGAH